MNIYLSDTLKFFSRIMADIEEKGWEKDLPRDMWIKICSKLCHLSSASESEPVVEIILKSLKFSIEIGVCREVFSLPKAN